MLEGQTITKPKKDPFDSDLTAVAKKVIDKKKRPSTDELFDKAQSMGVDPFVILLQIADGNKMALDLGDDDKPISPELRAMASREVMKYMYPTMKSAEITGKDGSALLPIGVKVMFEGEEVENHDEGSVEEK